MRTFKLGQKITVNHKLVRERQGRHFSWKIQMFPSPIEVTVVGVRVLNNGKMENDSGERYYLPTTSKRAIMVAANLKSTFYVYL